MKREFDEWLFPPEADFPPEAAADWELIYSVREQITLTVTFENALPSVRELKVLRELLRDYRDICETAIRNSVRLDKVEFLREYTLELLEKARLADIARQNLVADQTEVEADIHRLHPMSHRIEADAKALCQFKEETVYHYFAWCQQRALELQSPSPTP